MTKILLAAAAACLLATAPAHAGFVGECKAFVDNYAAQPDGGEMKSEIGKKFDDIGDFRVCSGNKIRKDPKGDLDKVTNALKEVNDAYEDGATQAQVDSALGKTGKDKYTGRFMMSAMACAAGG